MNEVLQITAFDTPLFLYHMTSKCMHGVFESSSDGTKDIIPNAFKVRQFSPSSHFHHFTFSPMKLS
jgi:hypothetical protein